MSAQYSSAGARYADDGADGAGEHQQQHQQQHQHPPPQHYNPHAGSIAPPHSGLRHVPDLYGPPPPSHPLAGGYYASSNTAVAAANYGTAPTHASPAFAQVDTSAHAMLPPIHVAAPPPPMAMGPSSSSSSHAPHSRRSLGSGEYPPLAPPPQPSMMSADPTAGHPLSRAVMGHPGSAYSQHLYQHQQPPPSSAGPPSQQQQQSQHRVPTPGAYSLGPSASGSPTSPASAAAALHANSLAGSRKMTSSPGQAHAPGGSGGNGGGSSSAGQNAQDTPKARSAMACQLCRRQKMKCEGPSQAPCRRCKAAGVECVFETPSTNAPRARSSGTSSWIDGRLQTVESRLAMLEDTAAANAGALVPRSGGDPPSPRSIPPEMVTAHERRIAALEQQLYSLQLAVARSNHAQPAQPSPTMGSSSGPYSSGYGVHHHAGGMPGYPPHPSEYDSPGMPPGVGMQAPGPPHDAFSTRAKHEADRMNGAEGLKSEGMGMDGGEDSHRGKRWKGEPGYGEPDFITRGLVSEEEAAMCFESYHLTFSSSDGMAGVLEQTHLSFDETRRRSPFFLATVISIGARSLSRFKTFHDSFREALRLARQTFLVDAYMHDSELGLGPGSDRPSTLYPSFRPTWQAPEMADAPFNTVTDTTEFEPRLSTLSLKALVLLGLYHAMPDLLMHAWIGGFRFIWPSSLLEYEQMTPEERGSLRGLRCINIARVGIVACLWHSFYTFVRHQLGFMDHTPALVRHHLELIASSPHAEPVTDNVMRTNLEENGILFETFKKLGPAMRPGAPRRAEVLEVVEQALVKLDQWQEEHADNMVTVSQWGDSADLKSIVPLHHGRMWLLMYIYTCIPSEELDLGLPQMRQFARMSVDSAIVILRWGVESRVWMPFSVVGNYVHNVQVPAAIFQLSTAARWYPDLLDCGVLRPILHRLLQQCEATIGGPGATAREISRARRTKLEVQELDRLAFDLCGDEPANASACSLGGRPGGGPLGAGHGGAQEDEGSVGLFGQEITASLASLRLELNLWAKPLQAFEGDD